MAEEKIREEITEEVIDRKGFIAWVKEHKTQLLLAGVSVTTILVSALGVVDLINYQNTDLLACL